jgi:hypothetical protein
VKRNSTAVIALLVVTAATALAQVDTSWVRRYSGQLYSRDSATALAVDPQGNVYVTGRSDTLGQSDIVTLKYDTNGNLLWRARFDGAGSGNDIPCDIEYNSGPGKGSGTVHVTGSSQGPTKAGDYDFVVLCYRADSGTLRWSATYDSTGNDDVGVALAVDPDGNAYAAGVFALDSMNTPVFGTLSYDTAGFRRWRSVWRGPDSLGDRPAAVSFAAGPGKGSGTVHVTGSSQGGGSDAPNTDIAMVAFSSADGAFRWDALYDYAGYDDSAVAVAPDPGSYGKVYVAGAARDSASWRYVTLAYDSLGDTLWTRVYDGGYGNSRPRAMAVTPGGKGSGTVHVTGSSQGPSKAGDLDYLTVCYSADGTGQWTARYDGGSGDDIAYAVAVAPTGGKGSGTVHVTGSSQGPSRGDLSTLDYLTVTYSATGVELWSHRYDNGRTDLAVSIGTDTAGGVYVTGASYGAVPDTSFDYATIKYQNPAAPPAGWTGLAPLPLPAYTGAWLACNGDGRVYACRGFRSFDFASYDPAGNSWTTLAPIGPGPSGKTPGKGSRGTAGGDRIWTVKANNTREFWCYDVGTAAWTQLIDVPLGLSNKKVKSGADLAYVRQGDTGYVYLLKGYKSEFYRYSTATGQWQALPDAPAGVRPKWDKGSFIVFDGDRTIYAQKGKYFFGEPPCHELWSFDVVTGRWATSALRGMPVYSLYRGASRKKKANEGAAGAWYDGSIYALKGGNTLILYGYDADAATWTQLEDMPAGIAGRRVKAGGDIDGDGTGVLYALKGNRTAEFYRYVVEDKSPHSGVASEVRAPGASRLPPAATIIRGVLNLTPDISNPTSDIVLLDAAGRRVVSLKPGRNDVSALAPGVYFVRSTIDNRQSSMSKVIIAR